MAKMNEEGLTLPCNKILDSKKLKAFAVNWLQYYFYKVENMVFNPFPHNNTFWPHGKQAFWKHCGKRRNCS